ncbi:DUF3311 domain-containing protein [uncultured Gimesia sp.]|uniref:DUF3311 domain-containing protein n=1 Tax=uncultured Gimesia sp. TaxID=1678688 RepID=UPI0030DD568E|tara:strand:+ start:165679 stop:165930 length:252 start_codon:yes stop_codon:yes gene_type:complete
MRYAVYGLVVVLIIIHQDNWLWDDKRLIFGFMPITLLYQAGISMGAAFVWFLATKFAWPHHLEEIVQEHPAQESPAQETGETE